MSVADEKLIYLRHTETLHSDSPVEIPENDHFPRTERCTWDERAGGGRLGGLGNSFPNKTKKKGTTTHSTTDRVAIFHTQKHEQAKVSEQKVKQHKLQISICDQRLNHFLCNTKPGAFEKCFRSTKADHPLWRVARKWMEKLAHIKENEAKKKGTRVRRTGGGKGSEISDGKLSIK